MNVPDGFRQNLEQKMGDGTWKNNLVCLFWPMELLTRKRMWNVTTPIYGEGESPLLKWWKSWRPVTGWLAEFLLWQRSLANKLKPWKGIWTRFRINLTSNYIWDWNILNRLSKTLSKKCIGTGLKKQSALFLRRILQSSIWRLTMAGLWRRPRNLVDRTS